jgi:hypothetical protein
MTLFWFPRFAVPPKSYDSRARLRRHSVPPFAPAVGVTQTKEATMNYTVIYPKTRIIRQLYKNVPVITDNEFVWEPDGSEEVWYDVSLNLASIEDLARKAAGNNGQVSRAGPLRVRVLKRERIA